MAIVGNIIKGVIELKSALQPSVNPVEAQKEALRNLLETAKATHFGKFYQFDEILASENMEKCFAARIPYFDYHKINNEWWHKILDGESDVTWPGQPDYFALSSGTTGKKSKRIPVTDAMLSHIKNTGIKQVEALSNFDFPAVIYEKDIMMLGSSTDLIKKNDHLEGEISGISASNIPSWFRGYYKPGKKIAKIDDWDDRVLEIAKNAKQWDIAGLSGIPSWIELMLQEVIAYHKVNDIHDIWPNLTVYTSGGVAFEPYKKSFRKLLKHPITVIDTYLASEGFIAFQTRPDTEAMALVTDGGIYFEFVPFYSDLINPDGSIKAHATSLTLEEVELEQDYVLVISTVSGAWRYVIGDTIQFTNIEKAEIVITGRTKFFLNVVGSQLSVNKMNAALREVEAEFDIEIPEFTLAAVEIEEQFFHHWYLGTDTKVDENELANVLDTKLKLANKNYKVARSKALKGVKVSCIPVAVFANWNGHQKKKGGQIKMERVMSPEKFHNWEEFVSKKK